MKILMIALSLLTGSVFAGGVTEKDVVDNLLKSDKALNAYITAVEENKSLECNIMANLTSIYTLHDSSLGFTTSFECFGSSGELILDYLVKGDAISRDEFFATRITIL